MWISRGVIWGPKTVVLSSSPARGGGVPPQGGGVTMSAPEKGGFSLVHAAPFFWSKKPSFIHGKLLKSGKIFGTFLVLDQGGVWGLAHAQGVFGQNRPFLLGPQEAPQNPQKPLFLAPFRWNSRFHRKSSFY